MYKEAKSYLVNLNKGLVIIIKLFEQTIFVFRSKNLFANMLTHNFLKSRFSMFNVVFQ